MIALITGILAQRNLDTVIVDVAGVGYELFIPAGTPVPPIGDTVRLNTYLHVREDALTLFGFADATTKDVFALLISASGIGPKLALTVLSTLTSDKLLTALRDRDTDTLTLVPGIGKKVAERMVLELSEKAGSLALNATLPATPADATSQIVADVHDALIGLGYSPRETDDALATLDIQKSNDPSDLLRRALSALAATKAT